MQWVSPNPHNLKIHSRSHFPANRYGCNYSRLIPCSAQLHPQNDWCYYNWAPYILLVDSMVFNNCMHTQPTRCWLYGVKIECPIYIAEDQCNNNNNDWSVWWAQTSNNFHTKWVLIDGNGNGNGNGNGSIYNWIGIWRTRPTISPLLPLFSFVVWIFSYDKGERKKERKKDILLALSIEIWWV